MKKAGQALRFNDEIEIDFPEDGKFADEDENLETEAEPTFEDLFPEVCEMVENPAVFDSQQLYIAESIQDANALNNCGYPSIVLKDGDFDKADNWEKIAEVIRDREVILIQGNFRMSTKRSNRLTEILKSRNDVRIVRLFQNWPEMPENSGLLEFFEAAGDNVQRFPDIVHTSEMIRRGKKAFPKIVDSDFYNTTNIPKPEWMIKDILTDQGLAQISGKPKCGKTFFVYELALACVSGSNFLGSPVKQGTVIYFDLETPERGRQDRLRKLSDGKIPTGIKFITEAEKIKDGFLDQLDDALRQFPDTVLVIVDTIKQIRSQKAAAADQNLHDAEEIGALAKFVHDREILMLCTNHNKKANEEDPFDSSLGSISINGALDTMLVLTQRQNELGETTERMLHVKGREVEEEHYRMQFNDCRWSTVSRAAEFSALENRQDFFTNPIVKTVQVLLTKDSEWKGRGIDLKSEIAKVCKNPFNRSSQAITAELKRLRPKFISYCGIDYEPIKYKGNNSTIHRFFKLESQEELDEAQESQIIQEILSDGFEEFH